MSLVSLMISIMQYGAMSLLTEITDRHAPIKRRPVRPNKAPYMNDQLKKAINVKRTLRKRAKKYKGAYRKLTEFKETR